jgi:FKBP-type peptidyl-prolyl cis-trans isomerase FkpA
MKYFYLCLLSVLLMGCSKEDDSSNSSYASNDAEIIAYLEANSIAATKTGSGLYYYMSKEGNGIRPNTNSAVRVAYKGYFTSGRVFDQSNSAGISFSLNQVIPGWTEGLTYFKEGGEGKLFIPSNLGYGDYGYGSIPGGSVLIFDIKLIEVKD